MKKYERAEIEVIAFDSMDVITWSIGDELPDDEFN